jgi:large subunit ribosomal protein L24
MAGMKLRKGMKVAVIAGKDRGQTGVVERVLAERNRVVVGGVNMAKKAVKATAQTKQAGLVDVEMPIHASNVMAVDPKGGKPTRIGYKITGKGKVRIAKKSGQELTAGAAK